uniref:Uncharacterized protein n=1 Tax=Aegilops tauschii subsp. strangulata TaxID=200361 RepID=A0A453EFT3_AEGTS
VQLPADAAAHGLQLPEDAAAWDVPPQPAGRAPLWVPIWVPRASRRAAPSPDALRCCRCTSSMVVLVTRCCVTQIHIYVFCQVSDHQGGQCVMDSIGSAVSIFVKSNQKFIHLLATSVAVTLL